MAIDTSLAFSAFPQQNLLQAYDEGQKMRLRQQMGNLQVQGARNELAVETAGHIARGVLSSENPEAAYPAALEAAKSMGFDVSALPQEYDERAQMMVRMLAMPEGERTEFERLAAGLPASERERALRIKLGLEKEEGGYGFEGTGLANQMYNVLMDPDAPEDMKAAARHYFSRPRPTMTESGLVMVPGEVPEFGAAPAASGAAAPTAGAPTGQPGVVPGTERNPNVVGAETAGRVAGARRILERAEQGDWKLLLDEDGTIDRQTLAQINNGIILTDKAQRAYNFLFNLMETKLRIMTGAAAPEAEVKRNVAAILPRTLSLAGAEAYQSAVQNELNFFETFVTSQEKVPTGLTAPEIGAGGPGLQAQPDDVRSWVMDQEPGLIIMDPDGNEYLWDGNDLIPQ